jgi:mannose-6-phosphate isomerase
LGRCPLEATGRRFPLLIKLLDCAEWLSLQVHPSDEQAQALEGRGQFGKTEAWHILEAAPGAKLIAGLRPGLDAAAVGAAIRSQRVLADSLHHAVQPGDTLLIPPGVIHALGPGLLLYEIQQSSDITYRVYDWDRPVSEARPLHIEKSLQVVDPAAQVRVQPLAGGAPGFTRLAQCAYFTLESLRLDGQPAALSPDGISFHALTVIEGRVEVAAEGGPACRLERLESLLVPAACAGYTLTAQGAARLLLASAPGRTISD